MAGKMQSNSVCKLKGNICHLTKKLASTRPKLAFFYHTTIGRNVNRRAVLLLCQIQRQYISESPIIGVQ